MKKSNKSYFSDFEPIFIGPRYTWGPIYGSESLKQTAKQTLLKLIQVIQVVQVVQVVQVIQVIDSIQFLTSP